MQASDLRLDPQEARLFLDTLVAGDSDPEEFTFQTLDDNQARKNRGLIKLFRGRLTEVVDRLERLNQRGAGVYVAINKLRVGRRCAENVCGIRALFVDLDGAPLDPVWGWKPGPHMVVESSPAKFHVYWRVNDSLPLDRFGEFQRKLAAVFNGDPSVCDLPRILRLPGAWHQKVYPDGKRSDPFKSRIIYPNNGKVADSHV